MALTDGHKALAGVELPQPVMAQQAHQEKEEGKQQPVMARASDGWKGKGRGKANDGSEAASSSADRAYICAWERREHKGPNPTAPPNPQRYMARGYAATQRSLQSRQMARDGQEVLDHLPATQKARDS